MTTPAASPAASSGPPRPPGSYVARRPEDVLALVPVVLGFTPTESVVMVTFSHDGAPSFHARIDLPTSQEQVDAAVEALLQPVRRYGVDGVCLVLYAADEIWARRSWRALHAALEALGVRVADAVRVDAGRYYPYLARDRRLRRDGVAFDLTGHPFLAQAVVEGRVLHGSRDELATLLAPDGEAVARLAVLLGDDDPELLTVLPPPLCAPCDPGCEGCASEGRDHDLSADDLFNDDLLDDDLFDDDDLFAPAAWLVEEGEWVAATAARHAAAGTLPTDDEVARLARAVRLNVLRDAALAPMSGARPAEPLGRGYVELWRSVVRRLPEPWVAGPAGLLAWAAWQHGEGALAWTAVERSLASYPGHPLAELVSLLLAQAMRPGSLPAGEWRDGLP